MNVRATVLTGLIVIAAVFRLHLVAYEPATWSDLNHLPMTLERWSGRRAQGLDAGVLGALEPDAYINRLYRRGAVTAGLYVGYHRSQTYGRAIHSPMNCLPGAGWQPISSEQIRFDDRGTVKRVVIEKGGERQLVLYWYQSLERIEGDEYLSRLYMLVDAFTSRRNDAALVRIVIPMTDGDDDEVASATVEAMTLARLVEPHVRRLLFKTI